MAGDLFDTERGPYESAYAPIKPSDPRVGPVEAPRLSKQCTAILAELRQGRRTNAELAKIAPKYSGRVSDLRAAGYDVRCVYQNHSTGVCMYALFVAGVEVSA